MYRAILPEGKIECADYQKQDNGVELHDDGGSFLAFVPYSNLEALVDEAAFETDDRSIV